MLTDVGEYIVGAYLQLIERCDFVQYNVRPPVGGLEGLGELDVVGFNFVTKTVFLCEVTTHVGGLLYGSGNSETVQKIQQKHQRQKEYADKYLTNFDIRRFQFWSPVVPTGHITRELKQFSELELIINGEYKRRVEEMQVLAKKTKRDARNPVFRLFQILASMRDDKQPRTTDVRGSTVEVAPHPCGGQAKS
jgi:hypothetical protein